MARFRRIPETGGETSGMGDAWEIFKHVLRWRTLPEGCDTRADRAAALLGRIAEAARAEDAAEVRRLATRALRDIPDPLVGTAVLVPRLLSDAKRAVEAEALALRCASQTEPDRRAFVAALLAVAVAQQARRAASSQYAAQALAALDDVDDDVLTAHIEARLAEAATWRGDILAQVELAERSLRRFERHGQFAHAAAVISMLLLPQYENGDLGGAHALIEVGESYARRAGSPTMLRLYGTFRVLHAAMSGDDEALAAYTGPHFSQSLYDKFVLLWYASMPYAWNGRWHDYLARVESAEPVTVAQRALVDATLAVGAAATRDDARARTLWRRAVHRVAHGGAWNLSDTRIRRVARALACAAGVAVGDVARAHRAALPLRGTRQLAVFTGEPEPTLAGYQRVVASMHDARARSQSVVELTPAQLAILATLATDATIADIARNDPARRSVATIRSHVQHLYDVLGVHSRTGAVLKAKELALL